MKNDLIKRTEQKMSYGDYDANNDRLTYWSGTWQPSPVTYSQYEEVQHQGGIWICNAGVTATTEEPSLSATDWTLKVSANGRAGMRIDTPKPLLGTIGAGWTIIAPFDSIVIPEEGATVALASGVFNVAWPGIWSFRLLLSMEHDREAAERELSVRVWNVTDSVSVGRDILWEIARQQGVTNIVLPFAAVIPGTALGDDLRFEIGNMASGSVVVSSVRNMNIEMLQFGPV